MVTGVNEVKPVDSASLKCLETEICEKVETVFSNNRVTRFSDARDKVLIKVLLQI